MFEHQLVQCIDRAAEWRKTGQTAKNEFSSRSHAICKITFTDYRAPGAPDGILYLVDLAGSEIAGDVATHGAERMRETREINKSLSILKDCIRIRAQLGDGDGTEKKMAAKKDYVPFRQSALTKVLKHVFDPTSGRNCKTAVVSCINPAYADMPATKNTLRYAEMLRVPVPKPSAVQYDIKDPKTWSHDQLRAWIIANVCQSK
jgi:kinesin family protein 2/24